ncbi:hypothetical protein VITFI_CDS0914 [Vitreoscilla filiformis]|uniref:Uncharacterized protein n=1 Tax=Vitreoscilla filiformis TaxID=63 RepID=A0A221KCE1_VITFI|nr:hypothetical protein VITFI_CDS0914 [Vitreoscilla filiformis]
MWLVRQQLPGSVADAGGGALAQNLDVARARAVYGLRFVRAALPVWRHSNAGGVFFKPLK